MYRYIYNDLVKWKNSSYRKPLILNGARQTGKTWILNEFGKKEYKNVVYINCDNNNEMKEMFYDFDVNRLILSFSALSNTRIEKENTLIILDEIQECCGRKLVGYHFTSIDGISGGKSGSINVVSHVI